MGVRKWVLAGWLLPVLIGVLTVAGAEPVTERRVDAQLNASPLAEVVKLLQEQAGLSIAVDEGLGDRLVSLQLHQAPAGLALALVAESAGLELVTLGEGRYRLRSAAPQPAAAVGPSEVPLERGRVKKMRLRCQNVAPSTIAGYFGRPGIRSTPSGIKVERPAPAKPVIAPVWISSAPAAEVLKDNVAKRTQERWEQAPEGPVPHEGCSGFMRLPDGILAMIGYDPSNTLIVVGEPKAADAFRPTLQQLDAPSAAIRLQSRLIYVPTAALERLTADWSRTEAPTGNGIHRSTAVADAAELLKAVAVRMVDGPILETKTGQAVVLSLTDASAPGATPEGFGFMPPFDPKDVSAVATTTDIRLTPWLTHSNGDVSLLVDPVVSDVVVGFAQDPPHGTATLTSTVPCVASTLIVPSGRSLVVAPVAPRGEVRSPHACALLARAPMVGELYRPAGVAEPALSPLVVIRRVSE